MLPKSLPRRAPILNLVTSFLEIMVEFQINHIIFREPSYIFHGLWVLMVLELKTKMKYPPQPGTAKIKNTPQESSDYLPTAPTVPEKCIFLFSNGLFIWFINSVRYRGASCFIPCETCMTWIHGTSPPTCRPDGELGVVSMSNCGTVEIFAFSSWKLPNGGRAVY